MKSIQDIALVRLRLDKYFSRYSLCTHIPLAFARPHTDKARSPQPVPIGDTFQRPAPLGTGVGVAPGWRAPGGWTAREPPSAGPSALATEPSPPLCCPRRPAPARSLQACSGAAATAMMVILVPSLTLITVTFHLCSQTHTNTYYNDEGTMMR